MATTRDVAEVASASAFSNGNEQAISNTAVLNAGGNILYLEWNPQNTGRYQAAGQEPSSSQLPENEDAMLRMLGMMSSLMQNSQVPEMPPSSAPRTIIDSQQISTSAFSNMATYIPENNENVTSDEYIDHEFSRSSNSETAVTMTPSHKASFLPSEALLQAPSSCEIYIKTMFPLKYGYPLWLPEPDYNLPVEYRLKGVSSGDVGIITPDGGFDFLFNIWHSAEDPINPDDLPEDFISLSLPRYGTSFQTLFNPGGHISNMDIESDINPSTKDISYTCKSGDKGAVLSLPHGAYQENLKNELDLKDFISKNALKWYSYVVKIGRDLNRHSLYLVTGCTKSKAWGIATFNKAVAERNSLLILGESSDMDGPSHLWKKSGGASSFRSGPTPNGIPNILNQCLFLRGFKISLSKKMWDSICNSRSKLTINENGKSQSPPDNSDESRASKNSRDNGGPGTSEAQHSSCQNIGNNISISPFPPKRAVSHPLNTINDLLLSQVPKARIAFTHDNLWTEFHERANDSNQILKMIQELYVVGYCGETKTCTVEPRIDMLLAAKRNYEIDFNRGASGSDLYLTPKLYTDVDHFSRVENLYGPSSLGTETFTLPTPPPKLRFYSAPSQSSVSVQSTSKINQSPIKTYSFVALPGNAPKKWPRRRYDEIEHLYQCSWPECTKAYGTLNHLNAHVTMQKHGPKRNPNEFKELRNQWRIAKKESKSSVNSMRRANISNRSDDNIYGMHRYNTSGSSTSLHQQSMQHPDSWLPSSPSISQHGSGDSLSHSLTDLLNMTAKMHF